MPKPGARSSSTYLTRRRWTEDDAREALADLEDSGLTPAAFAKQRGLDRQRLLRWRRVLGAPANALSFAEVPRHELVGTLAGRPEAHGGVFEIVLSVGQIVRVPPTFDASALRRLLAVLAEVDAC
jgi:transposase-like protein